jgi:hypothetical protein
LTGFERCGTTDLGALDSLLAARRFNRASFSAALILGLCKTPA